MDEQPKCWIEGCTNEVIDIVEKMNADGTYTVIFTCRHHFPDPATLSQFDVVRPISGGLL